jgi:hypothetical protein
MGNPPSQWPQKGGLLGLLGPIGGVFPIDTSFPNSVGMFHEPENCQSFEHIAMQVPEMGPKQNLGGWGVRRGVVWEIRYRCLKAG